MNATSGDPVVARIVAKLYGEEEEEEEGKNMQAEVFLVMSHWGPEAVFTSPEDAGAHIDALQASFGAYRENAELRVVPIPMNPPVPVRPVK